MQCWNCDKPASGVCAFCGRAVCKEHVSEGGYFEPTPEWDKERSWDRLWS